MCEMLLCPNLDSEQNPELLTHKSKTFFFSVSEHEHVAHLRAQHSYSYTMQNLVSLLSHSPEGLS